MGHRSVIQSSRWHLFTSYFSEQFWFTMSDTTENMFPKIIVE